MEKKKNLVERLFLSSMPERYEFIRKVAQGGFGKVYVAKDTRLGREVAIKRLLSADESSSQSQVEATFQREATTLAAMQHPNIVQIFDFDRDEEGSYVVMEMLEGETLKERIDRGPLSWDTFVSVARQALDAINAAHSKGILHRDLKPENLFLHKTPSGSRVLKILDFGLAKLSSVPSKQTMDQSGNVFGSIYYMAPEQFMRQPLDGRTDLYALGCVFYQALTSRFPFHGETMQATMEAHMHHQVKPVLDRRPDMSPQVAEWVMRLISFKAADRPADAMTALKQFDAAVKGVSADPVVIPVAKVEPAVITAPAPIPSALPSSRSVAAAPSGSARPTSSAVPSVKSSSAIPAAGSSKTGMQTRAMSALEASRLEARAKLEASAKIKRLAIMVGAPLVGILVFVLIFLRPAGDGKSSAPVTNSKPTSSPPPPVNPATIPPSAAPLTLPMEDFLAWRFRAGVEVWTRGKDSKLSAPRMDQWIYSWKNVAPNIKDSWLRPYENKGNRDAEQKATDVKGIDSGTRHPTVYFPTRSAMESRLTGADSGRAPGGPSSDPRGVTVGMVVRSNGGSKEPQTRPLLLTSTKGGLESFSIHQSYRVGQYWVLVEHQGQVAQALVRPDQFAKSGAGANWVALVATWNAVDGTITILVKSPDGNVARPSIQAKVPPGMPALDRLNVGFFYPPKGSKLNSNEKMDGDITEIAVYRRALDGATQEKLLNTLWDRYFQKR